MKYLKWIIRAAIWIWPAYWIAQIFWGDLGASPAQELTHKLGHVVLTLLTINLILGALLDFKKPSPMWIRTWITERRFWGVTSFLILTVHVFFYFVNEGFEAKAFEQIYTKTYLIFASLSFLILLTMAITSNNFSIRKFGGRRWKNIHRFIYLAQVLLFGHILLIEKANIRYYGTWLLLLVLLQIIRFTMVVHRRLSQSKTSRIPSTPA